MKSDGSGGILVRTRGEELGEEIRREGAVFLRLEALRSDTRRLVPDGRALEETPPDRWLELSLEDLATAHRGLGFGAREARQSVAQAYSRLRSDGREATEEAILKEALRRG